MSEPKRKQVQDKNQTAKAQQVEKQQVEQVETAVSAYPTLQRALADPDAITPNDVKILQRTFGNQAVRRFVLQRKMTVGPVGDKYEQEADAVAKQVVQTINTPTAPPVQRQDEEDELQMKPSSSALPMPTISTLQREWKPARPTLPPFPFLQRQEEEELQAKGDSMLTGGDLNGDLESSVQQAKSGGQPLGDGVRGSMEQAFNADFSGVKVHTDSQSDTLNRSISARAFTTGPDIFFRGGEYNPASSAGQTLIAHELTHTIQQGASPALRRQVDDGGIQGSGGEKTAVVQRQEEDDELAQMKPLDITTSSLQRQEEEDDLAQMKPHLIQRNSVAGFATDDIFGTNLNRQRESRSGQALIAHELTHVVQQNGENGERSLLPSPGSSQNLLGSSQVAGNTGQIIRRMATTTSLSNKSQPLVANDIIQRVAYTFNESWDYNQLNFFSGFDLSGVESAKQSLNDSLEKLNTLLSNLQDHNYYQNLTSFTSEEKGSAFLELKGDIDAIGDYVTQEDGSTVLWTNRTTKGGELAEKALAAKALLAKFANYLEDAEKQSGEEEEMIGGIKSTIDGLGQLNSKLQKFLSKETKKKREEARDKQRAMKSDKTNLVGFSELQSLSEEVVPIEMEYSTASGKLKAEQDKQKDKQEKEETRQRVQKLQQEKQEKFESGVKGKAGSSFRSLILKTADDYTLLDEVLTKARSGTPGQLVNALRFVDITEEKSKENFYALLDKVKLTDLNQLLGAIGANQDTALLKLLNTMQIGNLATLQTLIENTNDDNFSQLNLLISDLGGNANTALALLNQPGKPGDVRKVLTHSEVGNDTAKAEGLLGNKGTATDTRELLKGGVEFDDAKELLKLKCVKDKGKETAFVYEKSGEDLAKTTFVFEHAKYPATVKSWIDNGHTFDKIHEKLTACNDQKFWNGETFAEPKVTGATDVADLIGKAVNLGGADTGDFWYRHHGNYAGTDTMALPDEASSSYTEYGFEKLGDDTADRGVKRIVQDGAGNKYYSGSHYTSFYKI